MLLYVKDSISIHGFQLLDQRSIPQARCSGLQATQPAASVTERKTQSGVRFVF
jgi:hypothetical protein